MDWTCPDCDSLNEEAQLVCVVCSYYRKDVRVFIDRSKPKADSLKSRSSSLKLLFIAIVLIACVMIFVSTTIVDWHENLSVLLAFAVFVWLFIEMVSKTGGSK